jgi:hypothetical protein
MKYLVSGQANYLGNAILKRHINGWQFKGTKTHREKGIVGIDLRCWSFIEFQSWENQAISHRNKCPQSCE